MERSHFVGFEGGVKPKAGQALLSRRSARGGFRGTMVGRTLSCTVSRVTTTLATSSRLGDVVHGRLQHLFHDGAQPTGAGAAVDGLIGDGVQRFRRHLQLDTVHLEQPGVLLHQGVLRRGQDLHQRFLVQVGHRGDHRQTADEFRDQTELDQILRHDLGEVVLGVDLGLGVHLGAEAQAALATRSETIFSRPANAPATMNSTLVVSIWMNS